jgi:bla regulator protein BlaR1
MNVLNEFLSNRWADAVGWTLLHSLWQSLAILSIVFIILRFLPATRSALRYGVSCAGLLLTLITSAGTFLYIASTSTRALSITPYSPHGVSFGNGEVALTIAAEAFLKVTAFVQTNMPLIVTAWIAGFILFSLRLAGGFMYTGKLRSTALPVEKEWAAHLQRLSVRLGIRRLVKVGESIRIGTPMVIGYMKPIILLPVGMVAGLTTEQLEAILLHELAHIKRHDFLINVVQSFIETVFFFNPFTWKLSDLIRREREYCCDDLVIRESGSARTYAYALAQLEQARLSRNTLVLSLAADKNQLLHRIKRIMEKSVQTYSGKDRMIIPAFLLIAGVLCASWLSIQEEKDFTGDRVLVKQDTSIHKNRKAAKFSKKTITTSDENGQPHEEITESFEGDEDLRPFVDPSIPAPPEVSPFISAEPFEQVEPWIPSIDLDFDALPDSFPKAGFNLRDIKQWEEFSKEFQDKFHEKFDDFAEHQAALAEVMREMEEKFQSMDLAAMGARWTDSDLSQADMHKAQEEALRNIQEFNSAHAGNLKAQEEALESLRELDSQHALNLSDMNEGLADLQMNLRHFNEDLTKRSQNLERFEKAIRAQLIKDGYLSESEKIKTLEFTDDEFKVNGKSIKDSDKKKYQELHDEFLMHPDHVGKLE